VPGLRRLVSGFSQRRPGFKPRLVRVSFVVEKVSRGQIFLLLLRFSPFSIISQMLHSHLRLHVPLFRRTNGRKVGTFQKAALFRKLGCIGYKSSFTFFFRVLGVESGEFFKLASGLPTPYEDLCFTELVILGNG
jgi:hypothetical protein